jgi:hypothetical protein
MTAQKIHQMQVAYSQQEDRLLLRFNTSGGVEFRFWLTRLFVKKFWPGLVNTLDVAVSPNTTNKKKDVVGFMHRAAVEKADFSSKFEATTAPCPLGDETVLVCRAAIKANGQGAYVLSLAPEKGKGVELGVDQSLLHMLSKLILDSVANIDWGLSIQIPGVDTKSRFTIEGDNKKGRSLH